jgi:hypothetical protein
MNDRATMCPLLTSCSWIRAMIRGSHISARRVTFDSTRADWDNRKASGKQAGMIGLPILACSCQSRIHSVATQRIWPCQADSAASRCATLALASRKISFFMRGKPHQVVLGVLGWGGGANLATLTAVYEGAAKSQSQLSNSVKCTNNAPALQPAPHTGVGVMSCKQINGPQAEKSKIRAQPQSTMLRWRRLRENPLSEIARRRPALGE